MSFLILVAAAASQCANPMTQGVMTTCAAIDFQSADSALNAQYPITVGAMRTLDKSLDRGSADKRPGYAAALQTAQRAWLQFRDAQCVTEGYTMRGGTGEPMFVYLCKTRLTRDRIKQLRDQATGT